MGSLISRCLGAGIVIRSFTIKDFLRRVIVLYLNAENAGFRAGDVYQALAASEKALTVAEIAKAAKISTEDVILGIGWLFKEGKIKDEDNKVALA